MNVHEVSYSAANRLERIARAGVSRTINYSPGVPLFRIHAQRDGSKTNVDSDDFQRVALGSRRGVSQELVFSDCQMLPGITVAVRLTHVGEELRSSLEVALPGDGGVLVRTLDFPVIPVDFRVGADRLLIPSDSGELLLDPATALVSGGFQGEARFRYPGRAAMQYTEVYNQHEGLYVASYSTGDESFDIGHEVPEEQLRIFYRWYPFVRKGKWFSPTLSLCLHEGDWHQGADLYRTVMKRVLATPVVPDWMREDFHGWIKLLNKAENQPVQVRFRDLPDVLDKALKADLNILNSAGWSGVGFDTRYPDYEINEDVGTEHELRAALEEAHRRGGKILLYINGRLVDPLSEFYREGGDTAVVLKEDGTCFTEGYHTSVDFRIACPSSAHYRKWLAREIEYAMSLGADGLQIDQISMAPAEDCFAEGHEHSRPANNWTRGVVELLRESKTADRSANPNSFAWIEGQHEVFGQIYEVNQSHGECFSWREPRSP